MTHHAGPLPIILDRVAYNAEFDRLMAEAHAEAKRTSVPLSSDDITRIARQASAFGYDTGFAKIATAALNGDWQPAKERCRIERAVHGEEAARALMRSYQAAVKEKLSRMR